MKYVLLASFLALSGCGRDYTPEEIAVSRANFGHFKNNPYVYLFIDPENGCQYLSNANNSSLVPRNGPDGKQICWKDATK